MTVNIVTSKGRKPFLEEDETYIARSTSGPWRVSDSHGLCVVGPSGHGGMVADLCPNSTDEKWEGKREDARFIAQARNKWPDHVAALQRIRKLVDLEDHKAATELIRNLLEEL